MSPLKKSRACLLVITLLPSFLFVRCGGPEEQDIIIYGGTSAGVIAAIQADRLGKSVVLIEPGTHLGGLTSSGLGQTDTGDKAVIGGLAREFYRELKKYYDHPDVWIYDKPEQCDWYDPADDAIWRFEPHVAEVTFRKMLHNIPVVFEERLDLQQGVTVQDGRIQSITMQSGRIFYGKIFIDATYEGDLMAVAGVSYTVGREANSLYDETLNGVQIQQAIYHQFDVDVDPYVVPGDPSSGLLPGVHGDNPGENGDGDFRVQAYCFRMCLTTADDNKVPFEKPAVYDSLRYEILLRNFAAGENRVPLYHGMMPNQKTDTNNNHGFSTDNINMNYDYPEADYQRRVRIIEDHVNYQKGLMWTLANHPRVPESIRTEVSRWGLAKDEFINNGNWPFQLYIREARRLVSDYVMTEHDCKRTRLCDDPIGLGSYNMDSHNCQRYVDENGYVRNEGDVQVSPGGPYLISYRSIVPKRGEIANLLVPVCLSASHIAYGSIRMEPVFMILGQSAATAAALAIDLDSAVQDVPYEKLQKILLRDNQVIELPHFDRITE
ncbi:FAD-dependent oxidoreductase [candidate division KSB1 bacterium]|nr:FAD-dependent oxidoreductase [candidate division KSB1 bacterium]RQW03116.1 MAG: FAD-dependent oxidoreductase [candidate division KSB1 bacterium]